MDSTELIRHLKHENTQALSEMIKEQEKQAYIRSFPAFMDRVIREKHIKRKDIALRTGLSQDYTYKILNGSKRTTERDYILAICFALRMDLKQTQHALSIYGMPQLDENDARSGIIIRAIVILQYSNLGWVLWNRLGSEEAMIWYAMALEMMDDFLKDDHPGIAGQLRSRYSHIATLLDTFYRETGREKDRETLARRMRKREIPFEDR